LKCNFDIITDYEGINISYKRILKCIFSCFYSFFLQATDAFWALYHCYNKNEWYFDTMLFENKLEGWYFSTSKWIVILFCKAWNIVIE